MDNIFDEYVRRKGQLAPYFTSFCNDTTATCQGLSQRGTVTLAEQGLAPLDILRSYYPKDIEIAQTDIKTGILSSYPSSPLRVGSTGLDVQTIQTWLSRIRKNYPAIPVITDPEGQFQNSTQAAVTKFQSVFNLAPDGIVGKSTWYKISFLLNVASEYYPGIPASAQDGIFGSGTQQAVIAFQRIMQLNPDGIVGPLTWQALYNVYLGADQNVPTPSPTPDTIQYVVKAGDSLWLIAQRYGTTVEAIQKQNHLTGDLLRIGQVLTIPVSGSPSYIEYTVKAGDSLWRIANQYNTTVQALMNLNGLTSDLLMIGQILKVPVGSS